MRNFNIEFNPDGEITIKDIQGVIGSECLSLTQPYIDNFGIIVEQTMTNNFSNTISNKNLIDEKRI